VPTIQARRPLFFREAVGDKDNQRSQEQQNS
jgi:hypothetical protein